MKSPLITVLMVSTGVLTAMALLLAIVFELRFRQFRSLQPQVITVRLKENTVNSLATDALEYSRQHPAIDPILREIGLKQGAPAPAPAAKPAAK